jgi:hypothetical protein
MKATSKFIPRDEVKDLERCDAPDVSMVDRIVISGTN